MGIEILKTPIAAPNANRSGGVAVQPETPYRLPIASHSKTRMPLSSVRRVGHALSLEAFLSAGHAFYGEG